MIPADCRTRQSGEFYFGTWSAPLELDRTSGID